MYSARSYYSSCGAVYLTSIAAHDARPPRCSSLWIQIEITAMDGYHYICNVFELLLIFYLTIFINYTALYINYIRISQLIMFETIKQLIIMFVVSTYILLKFVALMFHYIY